METKMESLTEISKQVKELDEIWINHKKITVPKDIGLQTTVTTMGGVITAMDRSTLPQTYTFSLALRLGEDGVTDESFTTYLRWDALKDGPNYVVEDNFLILEKVPLYHAMVIDFENYSLTTSCRFNDEVSGTYVCDNMEELFKLFLFQLNK